MIKSFYMYYKLDWKKEDIFFNDKEPLLFVDYIIQGFFIIFLETNNTITLLYI